MPTSLTRYLAWMLLLLAACAARIPEPTEPWAPLPAPPTREAPPAPVFTPAAAAADALAPAADVRAPSPAIADAPTASDLPASTDTALGSAAPANRDAPAVPAGGPALLPRSGPNTPPPALEVCRVELATGTLPGGVVVARGVLRGPVASTQSGLLLKHPGGTWLVDGGMAADFLHHLRDIPGLLGLIARGSAKDWDRVAFPAEALRAHGVDPGALAGTIATHGHYDHLGGLVDLGVPIHVPERELASARAAVAGEKSSILRVEAEGLLANGRAIAFDGPAVGPWPASWDVYGDGSALVVPMPGHTPGSLGVLVRVGGRRAFLVGDTVWVREGYEAREPRSALASGFDDDSGQNDVQIARLWQLHQNEPDVLILPAHDRRQWDLLFGEAACVR